MIGKLLSLTNERGGRLLRQLLVWVVVTAVLQGVAFLLLAGFLDALFTGGAVDGEVGDAWRWVIALAAVGVAYAVAFWLGSRAGNDASTEVLVSLLDRLGDRLAELPIGWYAADRSGEAAEIATRGISFAASAPYAVLRPMLTAYLTPMTVLVGVLFIEWRVGLIMAVWVPLIWFAHRWLSRRIAALDVVQVDASAHASARVIEFARVQPALRAAGDNAIARRLVDDALRSQHSATRRVHVAGGAGVAIFGALVQFAVVAVIMMVTWLALDDELGVGAAVALLVLAVRFTEPIGKSGALGGGVGLATNTLHRIEELLAEETLTEPQAPGRPDGHGIRFDNVTFGYGGDPVLRDLTFTAPQRQMTAIVGPSGSGKTTVIRLIARFYDPEQGTVSIGGQPLPALGTAQVAAAVSPVFQDVYLFAGTIIDNIWIGDPDATRAQVLDAGRRACVDEIADRMPGGWDTEVGEAGTNLSGGERQRISIARALLKDSPIVLLDEATAALDIDNEQAIGRAFDEIRAGRTLVVVAHRLSTIISADRIIMLDGSGSIVEQGAHAQLLDADGDYARYWRERADATGWRLAPAFDD